MKLRDSHRLIILTLTFLVVFAGTVGALYLIRSWANPGYVAVPFERVAWAKADAEGRGHMVDSLLANYNIIGMTREQIIELAGQPDENQRDINRFRYYLGHMGRNPKASYLTEFSLLISFGADGKAISTGIAD